MQDEKGQPQRCLTVPADVSLGATAASSRWVVATDLSGFGLAVWRLSAP